MLKRMMMLVVAMLVIGVAFQASAGVISTPDSDAFGMDGTPPPGWTNLQLEGEPLPLWTAAGGVAVPELDSYDFTVMQRGTPGSDYYEYDETKKLVISYDMKPDHQGDGSGKSFVEFLTPAGQIPGGYDQECVGYYLQIKKNGSLNLYRDPRKRDGAGSSVASVSLGSAYNTSMHTYRIEIEYTAGTSADFTIYVDDVEKITYTDTSFMPKAGWSHGGAYTQFEVGVGRGHWPGGTQAPEFDNFFLTFEDPPAPIPEPGSAIFVLLGTVGLIRRRCRA